MKNKAAVELGRRGSKKGGVVRAANMMPDQRSDAAKKAADARWSKVKIEEEVWTMKNGTKVRVGDMSERNDG